VPLAPTRPLDANVRTASPTTVHLTHGASIDEWDRHRNEWSRSCKHLAVGGDAEQVLTAKSAMSENDRAD
jgi:hypothetical protein